MSPWGDDKIQETLMNSAPPAAQGSTAVISGGKILIMLREIKMGFLPCLFMDEFISASPT